MVSTKLLPDVRKTWEIESTAQVDFPKWSTLCSFIEGRIHAPEVMQFRLGSSGRSKQPYIKTAAHTVVAQKEGKIKYQICAQPHSIYQCETFMKASVGERQLTEKKSTNMLELSSCRTYPLSLFYG